mgnify:CR=1 FL=1
MAFLIIFCIFTHMLSVKKIEEIEEILKNYNGDNPYILKVKKKVLLQNNPISDFDYEYIKKNHNFAPIQINKIVKIADWYGEKLKNDFCTDFVAEKLKICTFLGATDTMYHCYIQYRQSIPPEMLFIPKKAVLTNFLVKDYHNTVIDFSRYDNLIHRIHENRFLKDYQKEGVQFLITRKRCILADTMGLGKTCTMSVAAIEGNFDSILIICPASLKTNWKNELLYFVEEKDISIIDGFNDKTKGELETFLGYCEGKSNKTKSELLQEAKETGNWKMNRFVIINFDILDKFFNFPKTRSNADFEKCLENSPLLRYIYNRKTLIIVDEVHKMADNKSIRYKIINFLIKKGNPDSVYLSTGTPVTNNPLSFYYIAQLLNNEEITKDWDYYMKRYCGAIKICLPKDKPKRDSLTKKYISDKKKNNWYELTQEEKNELQAIIEKNCHMQLIYKEATNLDELKERVAHIYLRRTKDGMDLPPKEIHELFYDLDERQTREYNRLWEEYEAEKLQNGETELNKELIEGGIYRRYLSNEMVSNTIKVTDFLLSKNEKVIIACCYDDELYELKDYYGDKCVIFNGKSSLKQKDEAVRAGMEALFEAYFKTFSIADAMKASAEKGVFFDRTFLYKLIVNPAFCGEASGGYKCEPYITKEQHKLICERIGANPRKTSKPDRVYLFTGLVRCGYCGYRMSGHTQGKNYKKGRMEYRKYDCPHYATTKIQHPQVQILETHLETYLLNHLDKLYMANIKEIRAMNETIGANDALKHKKALEARLKRLATLYEDGDIDVENYRKKRDAIKMEIEATRFEPIPEPEPLPKHWKLIYEDLDAKHRQMFWRGIIKNIVITNETRECPKVAFL